MKNTKGKSTGEVLDDVNVTSPGLNMKFFRLKMGATQSQLAEAIIKGLNELNPVDLSGDIKKEYDKLIKKQINQQLISDWERGINVPSIILPIAANFFKVDISWLTDYSLDVLDGSGYIQNGGTSYNNWQTMNYVTFNNDVEPVVEGFKHIIQEQKDFYTGLLKQHNIIKE